MTIINVPQRQKKTLLYQQGGTAAMIERETEGDGKTPADKASPTR